MNRETVRAYAERMSAREGRRVSLAESEAAIHEAIGRVAAMLASRFAFGYHTREDMRQEATLIAMEVLSEDPPKYDASRPLENFLHVHVRNQLSNYKRKHYARSEAPCSCCNPYDPPEEPCRKWRDWAARNAAKQRIMRPAAYSESDGPTTAATAGDEVEFGEVLRRIDEGLPMDLRADYLKIREGVAVPKARRQRVRRAILAILHPGEGEGDGE